MVMTPEKCDANFTYEQNMPKCDTMCSKKKRRHTMKYHAHSTRCWIRSTSINNKSIVSHSRMCMKSILLPFILHFMLGLNFKRNEWFLGLLPIVSVNCLIFSLSPRSSRSLRFSPSLSHQPLKILRMHPNTAIAPATTHVARFLWKHSTSISVLLVVLRLACCASTSFIFFGLSFASFCIAFCLSHTLSIDLIRFGRRWTPKSTLKMRTNN